MDKNPGKRNSFVPQTGQIPFISFPYLYANDDGIGIWYG